MQQTARWRDHSRRVAVVGAGISGLICARMLADDGVPVTIFEKGRGVGGRVTADQSLDQDLDRIVQCGIGSNGADG